MDLGNLRAHGHHQLSGPDTTTDHTYYTRGNRYYVSHYRADWWSSMWPTPQLKEVGYFVPFLRRPVTSPAPTGPGAASILSFRHRRVSDISNGLFVLKDKMPPAAKAGKMGFVGTAISVGKFRSALVRAQEHWLCRRGGVQYDQ
jgi:hypothetical protein